MDRLGTQARGVRHDDSPSSDRTPSRLTAAAVADLRIIAALGFAFDSYELLMLPLIVRPALGGAARRAAEQPAGQRLGRARCSTSRRSPAASSACSAAISPTCFGRRRVLVWSILLYAFSALAAGYSTSVGWLLFWRCCTFVGVCVEFVAAVAWLAELFTDPKQRERVVGYTQAFGSLGGIMVDRRLLPGRHLRRTSLPAVRGGHEAWRYTLMSGVIPAIPLMIIRPFLPESPVWQREEARRHAEASELRRAVPRRSSAARPSSRR